MNLSVSYFLWELPLFVRKFLSKESLRKLTFSMGWPHQSEIVNIEEIAQAGLYYTGKSDKVACICCDLILHEWKFGDVPIVDHYKYSPRCLFLSNPYLCQNEADVRGESQLNYILSRLAIKKRGIDEVDGEDQSHEEAVKRRMYE